MWLGNLLNQLFLLLAFTWPVCLVFDIVILWREPSPAGAAALRFARRFSAWGGILVSALAAFIGLRTWIPDDGAGSFFILLGTVMAFVFLGPLAAVPLLALSYLGARAYFALKPGSEPGPPQA